MHFLLANEQVLNVKRTRRKYSVALKITHDFNRLLVPQSYSDKKITRFISQEYNWIELTITKQRSSLPELPEDSGFLTLVNWFGQELKLQYLDDAESELYFKQDSQSLMVNKNTLKSPLLVKKAVSKWLVSEITAYLHEKVPFYALKVGVAEQLAGIKVKDYKSRWGSCYADGRLQFNWRLIMMPTAVIDYVIIHELCHLIHPNHSKQFWEEVASYCPLFKQHKTWLKQHGFKIMSF